MGHAIENQVPSFGLETPKKLKPHAAHTALTYMVSQVEGGLMCPMAMTYSAIPPLRANSTKATTLGMASGPGADCPLTGYKFYCSTAMCDVFLTLAYSERGLSYFLVLRWTLDGKRNILMIQRLKNKLGNQSNASSEIELQDTFGVMVGNEG